MSWLTEIINSGKRKQDKQKQKWIGSAEQLSKGKMRKMNRGDDYDLVIVQAPGKR